MWSRSRGRNPSRRGGMPFRGSFQRRGSRGNFRGGYHNKPKKHYESPHEHIGPKIFDKLDVRKGAVERLSEKDIGVTEYISNLDGFKGILKARYSDFQVNEIDKDGVVAQLTDLSAPQDLEEGINTI